jgi:hypothetical protein
MLQVARVNGTDGCLPRPGVPLRSLGYAKPPLDIPLAGSLDAGYFERHHRRPRRPVVLRGLVPERELSRWSFAALRDEYAMLSVPTHVMRAGAVTADRRRGVMTEARPLAEVLGELGGSDRPSRYMMARVEDLPAAFGERITTPVYCAGARWLSRKLWLSPAGTVNLMHWDAADNIHVQLIGSKRFTLVEAKESRRLYPSGLMAGLPNGCRVDIEAPDFARYPRCRNVQLRKTELHPGDGVYIPRGTWHHVRTLADSLSTNFWWARGAWLPFVVGADLFKRMRGVNR